jgi:protein gp37
MSDNSKIEWTDATWNPMRGGSKISPGCFHGYAETFAERFRGVPGHPFEFGFDLRLVPEKQGDPIRWSQPKQIFVNSMSVRSAAVPGGGFGHRPGACSENLRRDAAATRRRGRLRYE